jgi:xanthine dehydrogenase accessory factor
MNIWESAQQLTQEGTSFVMVTMMSSRGSAPQDPGAKMLVTAAGLYQGTVGGGKVELACIKQGLEMLTSHSQLEPVTVCWNLQKDIGMSCGGEVSFLFEHFHQSHWPIVIFGAGHVAQALTRILSKLNCQVSCVDSRAEWVAKLEGVKGICHPHPAELVESFNPKSFFMCMTMGHAYDVPILAQIAKFAPDCPYVGVIGSEVKGIKIKQELRQFGASETFLQKLRVPMGLKLGSNHPYEIAISIVAELLQVRDDARES